jgi:hypothetical protein
MVELHKNERRPGNGHIIKKIKSKAQEHLPPE